MVKKNEYIISGPKLQLEGTDELIGDFLLRSLKKLPRDKIFQVVLQPYEKITVGEFFKLSAQICQGLIQQGLKKGDIVTLVGDNSSQLHASFIGAIWAGGVPNPVYSGYTAMELKLLMSRIKAKWILCERPEFPEVSKFIELSKSDTKVIVLNSSGHSGENMTRLEDILSDIDLDSFTPVSSASPDDLVAIISSSGTTGVSKGVGLSHKTLMTCFLKWLYMPSVTFVLSQLITSFFPWITGVLFLILSCVFGCNRVVTITKNGEEILKTIEEYKVQGLLLPPHLLKCVLDCPNFKKYDLSSVSDVYTGGSILGKPLAEKFLEKWKTAKLYPIYGMTETGFISMPSPNQPIDSNGSPFYDISVKSVDVHNKKTLRPNETGELYVKASPIFTKYVGDEEATASAFVDDWFPTGDLGYLDENGNIFVTSREKEIFKSDNIQISPTEIELFISSLPGVIDVGVAGIPVTEHTFHLMALVVKSGTSTITAQDIQKSVAENFSEKKHLKAGVYFIDECPRSVTLKLKRHKLTQIALNIYDKIQLTAK